MSVPERNPTPRTPPILVLACGNPARGDDALGPLLLDRLAGRADLDRVEWLGDFQLQIEHALDIQGRERVIFVDALLAGPEPFAFLPIHAASALDHISHAVSPGALLTVFRRITSQTPPPAWLLAIRGYRFELGEPPTAKARVNLERAAEFLAAWLRREIRESCRD